MVSSRNFSNSAIAKLLKNIAVVYKLKKTQPFKMIAYEKAAAVIEQTNLDLHILWKNNKLTSLPGIGQGIANHLDELFRTNKVKYFERLLKPYPQAMFSLIEISGIGPKTAFKLCQKFNLNNPKTAVKQLEKLIKQKKISKIKGFSQESEENIQENINQFKQKKDRLSIYQAFALSKQIINHLKQSPHIIQIEPLGSLRRQASTIGDIDIAVITKQPKKALDYLLKYPQIKKIINQGISKASIITFNNIQIDIRFQSPDTFGSLLQHFTGSKSHNIQLRQLAQEKNLSLSEYGIKDKQGKLKKFSSEEKLYQVLGLDWIPPQLREARGEIKAAQSHKLPNLINLKDIKGDFHVHTNYFLQSSHDSGVDSFEVLIKKAHQLNYQYIGFADHNPSISRHSSQQIIDILKSRKQEIEKIKYSNEKNVKIRVLNLLEVDIRPDGSLAVPDKGLDQLDFAIASIHSSFHQDKATITNRLLNALKHPKIKILGHPSGRIINHRPSIKPDWDKIFDFCQKNNKFLEINAYPSRLDLPDSLIQQAVKYKVKFIINTDAHAVDQMNFMPYGIAVAKRGWLESKNVINTLPWNKLTGILNLT